MGDGDWIKKTSRSKRVAYFFNTKTGMSCWKIPATEGGSAGERVLNITETRDDDLHRNRRNLHPTLRPNSTRQLRSRKITAKEDKKCTENAHKACPKTESGNSSKSKSNNPVLNEHVINYDKALEKYKIAMSKKKHSKNVQAMQSNSTSYSFKKGTKNIKKSQRSVEQIEDAAKTEREHTKNVSKRRCNFDDGSSVTLSKMIKTDDILSTKKEVAENFSEDMEWESIVDEVKQARVTSCNEISMELPSFLNKKSDFEKLCSYDYIVADTNIYLSHFQTIKNIVEGTLGSQFVLVIPWRVFCELDSFKKNEKFSYILRQVLRYLHKTLPISDRIVGQSLKEASNHLYECSAPDDEILNCCLQILNMRKNVVLLSNDKNLCNKAIVNHVSNYTHQGFMQKLSDENKKSNISVIKNSECKMTDSPSSSQQLESVEYSRLLTLHEKVNEQFKEFLSKIIETEMKRCYEELWEKIVYLKPPWSVFDALECINKHWIAVFNEVLPRNAQQTIKELKYYFPKRRKITLSVLKEINIIVDICIQFVSSYKNKNEINTHSYINTFKSILNTKIETKNEKCENNKTESTCQSIPNTNNNIQYEEFISQTLVYVWNSFSKYCSQMANILRVPHDLDTSIDQAVCLEELVRQADSVNNQLQLLLKAISRVLVCPAVEDSSSDYKKYEANVALDDLYNCLNCTVTGMGQTGLSFNKLALNDYCFKHRNILEDGFSKFSMLQNLLTQCGVQYSKFKV